MLHPEALFAHENLTGLLNICRWPIRWLEMDQEKCRLRCCLGSPSVGALVEGLFCLKLIGVIHQHKLGKYRARKVAPILCKRRGITVGSRPSQMELPHKANSKISGNMAVFFNQLCAKNWLSCKMSLNVWHSMFSYILCYLFLFGLCDGV